MARIILEQTLSTVAYCWIIKGFKVIKSNICEPFERLMQHTHTCVIKLNTGSLVSGINKDSQFSVTMCEKSLRHRIL